MSGNAPESTDAVAELIAFGKAVVDSGLLASTCGNVSLRVDENRMALSASGSSLGALRPEDVVLVSLRDGHAEGEGRPSMENSLHRRVYLARSKVHAIVHCQSRAATLLACTPSPPRNLDFFPEVPAYVRAHAYVPWAMPGSELLAASVAAAFSDPEVTIVQMRNHGQVIVGGTWPKAVRRGVFFEMACWMASQGLGVQPLPADDAVTLRTYARDV
jgi:L-fuculose-phosphate aldolase